MPELSSFVTAVNRVSQQFSEAQESPAFSVWRFMALHWRQLVLDSFGEALQSQVLDLLDSIEGEPEDVVEDSLCLLQQ